MAYLHLLRKIPQNEELSGAATSAELLHLSNIIASQWDLTFSL